MGPKKKYLLVLVATAGILTVGLQNKVMAQADEAGQQATQVAVHTVAQGDCLWDISSRYNVTVREIQVANGLAGTTIRVGQTLKIPHTRSYADRVGIIDHGRIVAEGTPAALKADIGRPSVHAQPEHEEDRERMAAVLAGFGEPVGGVARGLAVRLSDGRAGLAEIVRALDSAGLRVAHIDLQAPTLDDVFLAKTGRTLEGAAEQEAEDEEDAAEVAAAAG